MQKFLCCALLSLKIFFFSKMETPVYLKAREMCMHVGACILIDLCPKNQRLSTVNDSIIVNRTFVTVLIIRYSLMI